MVMLPRLGRGLQTAMLRAAFALWVPWQDFTWENVIESEPGDVPILGNLLGDFDHDTWRRTEIILQFCCS